MVQCKYIIDYFHSQRTACLIWPPQSFRTKIQTESHLDVRISQISKNTIKFIGDFLGNVILHLELSRYHRNCVCKTHALAIRLLTESETPVQTTRARLPGSMPCVYVGEAWSKGCCVVLLACWDNKIRQSVEPSKQQFVGDVREQEIA